jgi:hypothetical protein
MDSLGVTFLGVIALASALQAVLIVALLLYGRRLARRLDEFQDRLEREIRPALDGLTRVANNLGEVSDLAVLQARRLDDLVADTVGKVEEATDLVRRVIVRPLGPLVEVTAFVRGIRRGLEVFHQLRGVDNQRRGPSHRYVEDEHLFI